MLIDDVARERTPPAIAVDALEELCDYRQDREGYTTTLVSNAGAEEFRTRVGERLFSRLLDRERYQRLLWQDSTDYRRAR